LPFLGKGFFIVKKNLDISIGQFSSPGRKKINQDFYGAFVPEEPQLSSKGIAVAIADGISSSNVSQIASETSVKGFLQDYFCTSDSWSVKTSVQKVLLAMNSWLYAQSRYSPNRFDKDKGYICTFSSIVFKSNTAYLFHCGDSRIYRLAGDSLEQLSNDHSRVVSEDTRYLTRALGIHNHIEIDYKSMPLQVDDIFVLATDGVYEYLSSKRIAEALKNHEATTLDVIAEQLVNEAYDAGSDDNLTLQIAKVNRLPDKYFDEIQSQIENLLPAPTLSPRSEFDGYLILREVYISSRSHVFLAQDIASKQKVIIKTPSTEMRGNQEYLESMLMEDWIAKRIDNVHVLKAVESGRRQSYLYTVTEFVEGQTLAQWMTDNPSPDIETVRGLVEQIAKGLQAFHRQEMVHQDLRPNNIMIDTEGTVKIIDFGATKVAGISEILPKNEGIMGTAQYTAPEYFLGEQGTARSDLFSLGVICYQLLSGKLPYGTAISKTTSARSQQRLGYHSLTIENNEVPGWVDYAISKATSINPLKRYSEVSELVYDLKHPHPSYLSQTRPPLIERNPVLFWQCISAVLLFVLIFQNIQW
jgi:serine/threonine protein phosphatase PrpC